MRTKQFLFGVGVGMAAFFGLGIPTALIPTGLSTRMIPSNLLDYVFLVAISALLGIFSFYSLQKPKAYERGNYPAIAGTVGGAFAFGCPICNVLLVSAFGSFALLAYFEPLRPLLGAASIGMLIYAIYSVKKKCKSCTK